MSTKIFNGFRFADPDLATIHRQIMEWRAELRPLHQQAANRFVAELAIAAIDEERLRPGSHSGQIPVMEGISKLWDMQAEVRKTQRRNPAVDFEFTISLMPFEGQVYGIVYSEQQEWLRLWMAKPFVIDFSYWDNTDPPEEVSEQDWAERGRVWDAILSEAVFTAPSMAGFAADCTHEALSPDIDNVVNELPSFQERISRTARFLVVSAEMSRRQSANPLDTRSLGSQAVEVHEWFRSEAGSLAFEAEKLRLANLLEPNVTKTMLMATL
jgi:hypothetical protein